MYDTIKVLASQLRRPLLVSLGLLPEDESLAALVVLGGGWRPETMRSGVSRLSGISASRLKEGIWLWRGDRTLNCRW